MTHAEYRYRLLLTGGVVLLTLTAAALLLDSAYVGSLFVSAAVSVVGAVIGGLAAGLLPGNALLVVIGVVLLAFGVDLLRPRRPPRLPRGSCPPPWPGAGQSAAAPASAASRGSVRRALE